VRRLISILLLLIYTTISSGVAVGAHYCGGRLASVNLSLGDHHSKCPCGSKSMKKDCCKDKVVYLQFKAKQKAQHYNLVKYNPPVKANFTAFIAKPIFFNPVFNSNSKGEASHSPPFVPANPPYLMNRVFRI
jgi:hypothetical protein